MRLSISTKFLLLVSILFLFIFGTTTLLLIRSSTTTLRRDLLEESKAFAGLASQPIGNTFLIYKDSGTVKIDLQVNQFSKLSDNVTNISVVNTKGEVVYSQHKAGLPQVSAEEANTFEPIFRNDSQGALETIIQPYFEASGAHSYSIVYNISDEAVEEAVQSEAATLLTFGLISLSATLALTYLLINRLIIKPIKQVSYQAGIISAGNLEQQIKLRGNDEISSLGDSVNKMADSLKSDIAELKKVDKVKSEFMMITSHNLRTPLTIINGYLDNMSLIHDPATVKEALNTIAISAKRLDVFAEDILTISQFELGDITLHAEEVVMTEFLGKILEEFKPTAEFKQLTLTTDLPSSEFKVKMSRPHMRSAIWNILDNAVKFTEQGGSIHVKLAHTDDQAQLSISDTGIGILASEMPKLFTKFHRGTSTLHYDFEGTGIGLYSSKVIIERQGGSITATSKEGKGSTFVITLPIAKGFPGKVALQP